MRACERFPAYKRLHCSLSLDLHVNMKSYIGQWVNRYSWSCLYRFSRWDWSYPTTQRYDHKSLQMFWNKKIKLHLHISAARKTFKKYQKMRDMFFPWIHHRGVWGHCEPRINSLYLTHWPSCSAVKNKHPPLQLEACLNSPYRGGGKWRGPAIAASQSSSSLRARFPY